MEVYRLTARPDSKRPGRKGLLKCKYCRRQFSVTVKTVFEDSHIALRKWVIAIHLMCASKKGVSAHQLHRMLGMTYRSAWFLAHRIRHAMSAPPIREKLFGVIEADETYVGGKRVGKRGRPGPGETKAPVFALVQRGGDVRAFAVRRVTAANLKTILRENVDTNSAIVTDEHSAYIGLSNEFGSHETVNHSAGEYARAGNVHINSAEGFFGILKRGINGTFHHISQKHLPRYLHEFEFRFNSRKMSDGNRMQLAVAGFEGKRLKYRD
jgi:transposase-like protein